MQICVRKSMTCVCGSCKHALCNVHESFAGAALNFSVSVTYIYIATLYDVGATLNFSVSAIYIYIYTEPHCMMYHNAVGDELGSYTGDVFAWV